MKHIQLLVFSALKVGQAPPYRYSTNQVMRLLQRDGRQPSQGFVGGIHNDAYRFKGCHT